MTHYRQNKSINDVIYGYIELSEVALLIIDTIEFQTLRQLKQLGCVHFVFPSAVHTRFEHSIGVYHLAGVVINNIIKNSKIEMDSKIIEMIKIAGLVHDIGHVIGSHLFDNHIAKKYNLPDHEERSVQLFQYIMKKYQIGLCEKEIALVVALIKGEKLQGYPEWIFEIISNSRTQLDVDKCDYLVRDAYHLGMPSQLQIARIYKFARVIDDKLCFHQKVYLQIADVFMARYRQHKEVYQHRVVLGIELLIVDILNILFETQGWAKLFSDDHSWRFVTDSIIENIPRTNTTSEAEEKVLELYKRLYSRDLYQNIQSQPESKYVETAEITSVLGFSNSLSENPMRNILFYNHEKKESFHIKEDEISALLSNQFVETKKLIYSKTRRILRKEIKIPQQEPSRGHLLFPDEASAQVWYNQKMTKGK